MSAPGSMANVALRPWPAPAKEALSQEDVWRRFSQLAAERGHPRAITEKALQEEVDAGKGVPEEAMDGIEQEQKPDAPSTKDKLEEIHLVRNQMFNKLDHAAFHAANALDLIAILLSKDRNKNLENSYSAKFKAEGVPPGSFGLDVGNPPDMSDRVEEKQRLADKARRQQLVMKGSRAEALDWATDHLLSAAKQLEGEVRKETKYWDEILSISEKGWSIQRTRRDVRHAPFAVRYGLPEASNHFKARGLAPLRMDKDGGIVLDRSLRMRAKTLRIRITDKGKTTGTSHLPTDGDLSELAIETSIQLARDSLFEEELFHEMSMEARQLIAYGVELRNSVIHIGSTCLGSHSTHREILIDCIPRDELIPPGQDQSQDWLARSISEALRLFLAHEHRLRLHRRSQDPPPMTQYNRHQPSPPLLRTLLGVVAHLGAVDVLHTYFDVVVKTLQSAGLGVTLEAVRETSWVRLTDMLKESTRKDLSAMDQLLQTFTKQCEGNATISLPSASGAQTEVITIATRTYMGHPHFGAEHKLTLPLSLASVLSLAHDQSRQFKFSSDEDVKSYLDWILALDISHSLLFKEYSGRAVIKSQEPHVSILSKGNKKGERKEIDIAVELEEGIVKVTARSSAHLATGAIAESFTWSGASAEASLRDKVKSWVD